MDRTFCLNTLSAPASDREVAYELFNAAIDEVLKLRQTKDDRFNIIYEVAGGGGVFSLLLCDSYTIRDFLGDLIDKGNRERGELIIEMLDKGPALSSLTDDEAEELASVGFYFEDEGYRNSLDVLAVAWFFEATLLSLNTAPRWAMSEVSFAKYDGSGGTETYKVANVSSVDHAQEILAREAGDEQHGDSLESLGNCVISEEFAGWYAELDPLNRRRLWGKLQLAQARGFSGGKPLFETLSDAGGMREMRVPFFPGGAIRVLFGVVKDGKIAILVGFVKKSDNEGYTSNIARATKIWGTL